MRNIIKIGIISTGVGIRTNLKGFRNFQDDAEVYAIAGSNLDRSKYFADEDNIPVVCGQWGQSRSPIHIKRITSRKLEL